MIGANRATILRQDEQYLKIDRSEQPLEPRHLGVPSGVSKTIFEPMVRLAQVCPYLASRLALSQNRPK
jgi:hypothetical protein